MFHNMTGEEGDSDNENRFGSENIANIDEHALIVLPMMYWSNTDLPMCSSSILSCSC